MLAPSRAPYGCGEYAYIHSPEITKYRCNNGAQERVEQPRRPAPARQEQEECAQDRARDHPQRCEQIPIKGNAGRKVIVHAQAHPKHRNEEHKETPACRGRAFAGKGGKAGESHKRPSMMWKRFFCEAWGQARIPAVKPCCPRSCRTARNVGRTPRRTKRNGSVRGKKKEATRFRLTASRVNQSSSVGRMVSTGQVAFFTTFSATEPNRIRSMPLRPRVPITMMSACSLSARARISSAA